MKLSAIDARLYQQRYKRVAIGLAVSLAILSLSFSTALIAVFGNDEVGGNTALNAAGVLLALAVLLVAMNTLKHKPYFKEVAYVWALKRELTQINRHMNKIKAAAEQGDIGAMVVLNFSYVGSQQLWQLENNTLMMEELRRWQSDLEQLQQRFNVKVSLEDYRRELLNNY